MEDKCIHAEYVSGHIHILHVIPPLQEKFKKTAKKFYGLTKRKETVCRFKMKRSTGRWNHTCTECVENYDIL